MAATATIGDIKQAYRKKALTLHPDTAGVVSKTNGSIEFQELVTAYRILSDPESRKDHDHENTFSVKWQENQTPAPPPSDTRKKKYGLYTFIGVLCLLLLSIYPLDYMIRNASLKRPEIPSDTKTPQRPVDNPATERKTAIAEASQPVLPEIPGTPSAGKASAGSIIPLKAAPVVVQRTEVAVGTHDAAHATTLPTPPGASNGPIPEHVATGSPVKVPARRHDTQPVKPLPVPAKTGNPSSIESTNISKTIAQSDDSAANVTQGDATDPVVETAVVDSAVDTMVWKSARIRIHAEDLPLKQHLHPARGNRLEPCKPGKRPCS